MYVELKVQRRAFFLQQIRTNREIEKSSRTNAAALKVNLVIETRIETGGDELRQRCVGIDIRGNTRIVPAAKRRINPRRFMVVAELELGLVSLIVVGRKLQALKLKFLRILAEKKTTGDWRDAVGMRVGKRQRAMKAMQVGRFNSEFFTGYTTR